MQKSDDCSLAYNESPKGLINQYIIIKLTNRPVFMKLGRGVEHENKHDEDPVQFWCESGSRNSFFLVKLLR